MYSCYDPDLREEQARLMAAWNEKYKDVEFPDEDPEDYMKKHGSKKLLKYFDMRDRQEEYEKKHHCVIN